MDIELDKYVKLFEGKVENFNKFCETFLIDQAYDIVSQAKERTPVDTGALRSDWSVDTSEVSRLKITIKNGMEYASIIEYGDLKTNRRAYNMISVPLNKYNANVSKNFQTALEDYFNWANSR